MNKKRVNDLVGRSLTLLAAACVATASSSARAQPADASASGNPCADVAANDPQDLILLSDLMLKPHKFSSVADLLNAFPPEAMGKIATLQKRAAERQAKDWPNLCRYAAENAQLVASGVRPQTVFLGDSITENWKLGDPALFNASVLDRGISGQTTPQILLRFYQADAVIGRAGG
ncbi:hypothetical protein [Sphingomonas psychrolutea]|uniref:Uncharacterized protein n=1 Tax=Sphingomonas psychrolutea TaxID=1259676 RepID=A0ABQ1G3B8_9SPHN|nr:hypothetical protein [Sphingomonas psychrolutea]GGA36631.1 hypothetical protein GCM10011395_03670 [Sphingomonas psychrolutea]